MIKDIRIGNYVIGSRYNFTECKYKIVIALSGWENTPVYLENTFFSKDLTKTTFDS